MKKSKDTGDARSYGRRERLSRRMDELERTVERLSSDTLEYLDSLERRMRVAGTALCAKPPKKTEK